MHEPAVPAFAKPQLALTSTNLWTTSHLFFFTPSRGNQNQTSLCTCTRRILLLYPSAHRSHVSHGDVLGRAAGCSVRKLEFALMAKDLSDLLIYRTITAITVALSVPVHMQLIPGYYVAFLTYRVLTWRIIPEVWRLLTPFFITSPNLGLLMDPYFLWMYSSQLERESSRFSQPGEFFTYLIFVCSVILVSRDISAFLPTRKASSARFPSSFLTFNLPLSARPAALSCDRFLVGREITPALCGRSSFAINPRAFVECGHGGIPVLRNLLAETCGKTEVVGPYISSSKFILVICSLVSESALTIL